MTKIEFILSLKDKLSHLPQSEVAERLNFYCEMIEDRVEEGLSEEEAVASVGSVEEIAAQILGETTFAQAAEQKPKRKKRPPVWLVVIVVLFCPALMSLLIASVVVAIALCAVAWAVIASLWAVFGSLVASAVGVLCGAAVFAFGGKGVAAAAMAGAGMVCAGVYVFMFMLCRVATDGAVLLTKKIAQWIKNHSQKRRKHK